MAYYKFIYDKTDSSKLTNLSPYNYGQRELINTNNWEIAIISICEMGYYLNTNGCRLIDNLEKVV